MISMNQFQNSPTILFVFLLDQNFYFKIFMSIQYNRLIEYTYLKNDTTRDKIKEICETAVKYDYYGVCCYADFINDAKFFLKNSTIKIITVASFPEGTFSTEEKLEETKKAIDLGADEIDVVMNYRKLKAGDTIEAKNEISALSRLVHEKNRILKIIIESGLLTFKEIKLSCKICAEAGVDFIKTSTGTIQPAAEIEKVKYMREILPENIKIKAAGGIKNLEQLITFYEAGADRIGTSALIIL